MSSTILWYDLETFGLNPRYDRIAQAAAVRTDMDLNIIGAPLLLYAKLSPDYLPNPGSCLITGITPQECNTKGMPEAEMIGKLVDEMMVPDTITCGYNSIRFDDECVRSTLYRNLYDPYEREYLNGCSRWDLINLVRATRDLRPEGMCFEKKNEAGFPSFRLTDLTEENHIEQVGAHDALVDVYATIGVAKMIKVNQPKLWAYALSHRDKDSVKSVVNHMTHRPFLHTSPAFASKRGNTRPLLPLFITGKNDIWCFDLTHDIPQNPHLDDYENTGLYKLSANRCPFVAPLETLGPEAEKRLGFTKQEILRKAKYVMALDCFDETALLKTQVPFDNSVEQDPDIALYGSLMTREDKKRLKTLRLLSPQAKLKGDSMIPFDDPKYHKLVWRQIARNWPDAL
ncbi:MAG: exodeoxyribonuclease I, partial [Spirochaetales bacterium]|nr:exodeoxyribonuclease I [Candidatus Physcosoma equi]